MKVILLKDVKGMGRAHDTVETKDGHALNFLIPQKLAVPATVSATKSAESHIARRKERDEVQVKLIADRLTYLGENTLTVQKKANEKGHLYDALDAKEIAALAELPEEVIRIQKPFKELGTVEVPVASGDTMGAFSLVIEAE